MSWTHSLAGSAKERQQVGLPGHCERCAQIGHVRAHSTLGCGDVGCTAAHAPDDHRDTQPPPVQSTDGYEPTQWWRSTYFNAHGAEKVWAEASDEEEVRASLRDAPRRRPGPRLYRLWEVRQREWRRAGDVVL